MDETLERDLKDQSNWTVRLSSPISLARAEVTKFGDENCPRGEVRLVEAGELALPQFSSAMVGLRTRYQNLHLNAEYRVNNRFASKYNEFSATAAFRRTTHSIMSPAFHGTIQWHSQGCDLFLF
ncbi:hypothetical protein I7I51_00319 [Histoplasma capsulatum]|uniref:Uncharacterized protein n=1 Tax=Ajellomyces capsulatus TaxID=5037 RepID=A0A8A1MFE0_AJECA|nr:hypothetical protein I7I51_00319 [Histoplasma capsulatum]